MLIGSARKGGGRVAAVCSASPQRDASAPKQAPQSSVPPAIYYLYCLSFLGFTMGLPLGPALAKQGVDVGTFTSCFFLGQLVGNAALPIYSSRVGIVQVLLGSLAISAAAWFYLGYALQHSMRLRWILLARSIAGFGCGIVPVLRSFLARTLPDKDRLSTSLAYGEAAAQVAFTLGPLLGGVVADWFGLNAPFYFMALLCAGGAVASLWAFREQRLPARQQKQREEHRAPDASQRAICWKAWRTMGVSLVLSSVRFLLNLFIPFLCHSWVPF